MHALRDTRVDACLYFIPPHRLRQVGWGGGGWLWGGVGWGGGASWVDARLRIILPQGGSLGARIYGWQVVGAAGGWT